MTGESQRQLRRVEPRSEVVVSEVKGIATRSQGREQGPFILWDVSDHGLRLWMPVRVKPGEVVRLTIAKPFVLQLNCDVRWCKPMPDGDGFLVGLKALDNLQRLEALHRTLQPEEAEEVKAEGASR